MNKHSNGIQITNNTAQKKVSTGKKCKNEKNKYKISILDCRNNLGKNFQILKNIIDGDTHSAAIGAWNQKEKRERKKKIRKATKK